MTAEDDNESDGIRGLSDLAQVVPPTSLVPAVMRRITEPEPTGLWHWLRRPHSFEIRLSPLAAGALMAALGMVVFGVVRRPATESQAFISHAPSNTMGDGVVSVRFVLAARGAKRVAIAGDFNAWNPADTILVDSDGQGMFVATIRLPRGAHEYMFVVDGEWVTDPAAAERRPDGYGRTNAILRL